MKSADDDDEDEDQKLPAITLEILERLEADNQELRADIEDYKTSVDLIMDKHRTQKTTLDHEYERNKRLREELGEERVSLSAMVCVCVCLSLRWCVCMSVSAMVCVCVCVCVRQQKRLRHEDGFFFLFICCVVLLSFLFFR